MVVTCANGTQTGPGGVPEEWMSVHCGVLAGVGFNGLLTTVCGNVLPVDGRHVKGGRRPRGCVLGSSTDQGPPPAPCRDGMKVLHRCSGAAHVVCVLGSRFGSGRVNFRTAAWLAAAGSIHEAVIGVATDKKHTVLFRRDTGASPPRSLISASAALADRRCEAQAWRTSEGRSNGTKSAQQWAAGRVASAGSEGRLQVLYCPASQRSFRITLADRAPAVLNNMC
jgi:hypothetical protein